jgi:hypothetical protein
MTIQGLAFVKPRLVKLAAAISTTTHQIMRYQQPSFLLRWAGTEMPQTFITGSSLDCSARSSLAQKARTSYMQLHGLTRPTRVGFNGRSSLRLHDVRGFCEQG